jgi:hypothetical protein
VLAVEVKHNDVDFALRLLKKRCRSPVCSVSSGDAGTMKSHQNADVGKNVKALKILENVPWRLVAKDEQEGMGEQR